ncbi:hypothetical protein HBNCFIEN_00491 [Legionella sp. PC997]|nr:hypothetical protein HBNCFIEN_00491 [Legionella sp. PC997]
MYRALLLLGDIIKALRSATTVHVIIKALIKVVLTVNAVKYGRGLPGTDNREILILRLEKSQFGAPNDDLIFLHNSL